jgi:sugar phosphate isomerase/epimerase
MATIDHDPAQFGWCGPLARAEEFQAAGADYIEAQLVPMLLEDDACLAEAKARVRELPLPALAMSYLFPHDVRVVGDQVNEARNRRYFDRVVELLALAGSRIVVFGSGWTRNVPDGWEVERAESQFLHTLDWCARALQGSGTTLVIEPLNRKESNLCTSVSDGVRLARLLNRPEVRGLADFYHMDEEREPLATLENQGGWLAHVHLADTGRLNPGTGEGAAAYDYPTFFTHLKNAGYSGLMSCECGVQGEPIPAMRHSLQFLRQQWKPTP